MAAIQLPPGFKIDLYAVVSDARHMAVGTNAGVVYVCTRKTKVWAVTDRTRARVADEVKQFAPSIAFRQPNGVCFSKDGQLYVAEHNRVLVFPAAEFFYEGPDVAAAPHAADLGMHFYRGKMFPEQYRGAIFSAQHSSWNRTTPVGARVMVTTFKPDGTVDKSEPFAFGWLNDETGEYSGRPVDVAELADGSLLVSDDFAGAIYRISYKAR